MADKQIRRAVRRIAMQMVENTRSDIPLTLIGINTRGFQLAKMLQEALFASGYNQAGLINLDTHQNRLKNAADEATITASSYIILVDDVLFSGSTMIQALRYVLDQAKPEVVKIAVLVDRGHRKFPIQPDYVGIVSPTKLNEHVSVNFSSTDKPDRVLLEFSRS